jgi:hypothetical protein
MMCSRALTPLHSSNQGGAFSLLIMFGGKHVFRVGLFTQKLKQNRPNLRETRRILREKKCHLKH